MAIMRIRDKPSTWFTPKGPAKSDDKFVETTNVHYLKKYFKPSPRIISLSFVRGAPLQHFPYCLGSYVFEIKSSNKQTRAH
jgi:hypothetical protein